MKSKNSKADVGTNTNQTPGSIHGARIIAVFLLVSQGWGWAQGPQVFSSFGTPKIDGRISAGEWADASWVDIAVNLPEGGTAPGRVAAMNDRTNLYFAIQFARSFIDPGNSAVFELDKDGGGDMTEGDDILLVNPSVGFFDGFRTTNSPCATNSICGFYDAEFGGQTDGAGAFDNDGSSTAYEFAHPLRSPDAAHDIQLQGGESLGFTMFLRLISRQQIADTDLWHLGIVLVASEPCLRVNVDIRPGVSLNTINPKSHGKIPVAILSRSDFNAVGEVDIASLTFGRTGDESSLERPEGRTRDVNGDGLPDLVCVFEIQAAHFSHSDMVGVLKGRTLGNTRIEGSDSVRAVGK